MNRNIKITLIITTLLFILMTIYVLSSFGSLGFPLVFVLVFVTVSLNLILIIINFIIKKESEIEIEIEIEETLETKDKKELKH